MGCLTVNQGFNYVRVGIDASLWIDYMFEEKI